MRKLFKILLGIVITVLIISAVGLAVARFAFPEEFKFAVTTLKQFGVTETVKLAYDFVTGNTLDEDSFNNNKAENDKQLQDSINNHGYNITDEQLEKLNSGNLSEDEIAEILMGNDSVSSEDKTADSADSEQQDQTQEEQTPLEDVKQETAKDDKPVTSENKDDKTPDDNKNEDVKKDDSKTDSIKQEQNTGDNTAVNAQDPRVAKLIARMYVLKSRYMGEIESIVNSMKAEYVTYPASERTTSLKASIATKYMNSVNAMEAQCDAQVDAIVSELREVLRQTGADESLADSILSAYKTEKSSTKSYYIGKYAD